MVSGRYARQVALSEIGAEGQRKLESSAVVIVGCGALGSAQAEMIARAGVGRITIIDGDTAELHNLPRQIMLDERDVRERLPKAEAAARHLRLINSEITIEAVVMAVTSANIDELLRFADLVLDGTDNFETRYLLNDYCVKMSKPWVYGGVLGTAGSAMVVRPGFGPCLRCIFPEPPNVSALVTCQARGVLNAAVLSVAALQAAEALKLLVGDCAQELRLYGLDVWKGSFAGIKVKRLDECVCCVRKRFDFLDA